MVNLSGISYDHRMTEDTGASVSDVVPRLAGGARGARLSGVVGQIGELDHLRLEDQLSLLPHCRRTAERCSMWFMRHRRPPLDIAAEVARFRQPVLALSVGMLGRISGRLGEAAGELVALARLPQGVPEGLAMRTGACGA